MTDHNQNTGTMTPGIYDIIIYIASAIHLVLKVACPVKCLSLTELLPLRGVWFGYLLYIR